MADLFTWWWDKLELLIYVSDWPCWARRLYIVLLPISFPTYCALVVLGMVLAAPIGISDGIRDLWKCPKR